MRHFLLIKKENLDWFKEVHEYELKEKLFTLYKSIIDEAGKIFREYGYIDVSGESSKGHPAFVYTQSGTTITGPEPKNEDLLDAQKKWLDACKIYVEVMEQLNREEIELGRKKRLICGLRLDTLLFSENGVKSPLSLAAAQAAINN